MTGLRENRATGRAGFTARLARDKRANVLPMVAAGLVPLIAMVGGAIDASRLYMARTRLQQACDSGALAGRRAMNNVTVLTPDEENVAKRFFGFNFPEGTYSATSITSDYAKGATDGTVTGSASLVMPTTVMKFFGFDNVPLSVTCDATLVIPNTDVMFVLDVTGSMRETPTGDTVQKIDGLKQAVKDFFSVLGPGAANGPGRIRYGFVPYSSNVNVGRIIYDANPAWIAGGQGPENHHYQSRRAVSVLDRYPTYGTESGPTYGSHSDSVTWSATWADVPGTSITVNGTSYQTRVSNVTSGACSSRPKPPVVPSPNAYGSATNTSTETVAYPDTSQTKGYSQSAGGSATQYQYKWAANSSGSTNGTCQLQRNNSTAFTRTRPYTTETPVTWNERQKFSSWTYADTIVDVSPFVRNGSAVNPTYWSGFWTGTDPNLNWGYNSTGGRYTLPTPSTVTWGGCIEEADTNNGIVSTSSLNAPSDAFDLDIDLVPNRQETRWKPFLPELQFYPTLGNYLSQAWLGRVPDWINNGFAACPREASRLTQYTSDYVATTKISPSFDAYVNSLAPIGGTTHDIGLIWGARFLSPNGIFAAQNSDSTGPGGFQISRHIVFMTDGMLDTNSTGNDPWGITALDGRIAPTNAATKARNDESHNRRVEIICNSMKGKGFTIWVVGFGIPTMPTQLQNCATSVNHWSLNSNSAQLKARFKTIAETIGGLRLSQ